MERREIERLRERLSCAVVLEQAGFELDRRESTRRAVKYRRGGEIIIMTHGGMGWFDPLSDGKGDVFALIGILQSSNFAETLKAAVVLAGLTKSEPVQSVHKPRRDTAGVVARWLAKPLLRPNTPAFHYLAGARAIPVSTLQHAALQRLVRQGPHGSAWFAHEDDRGRCSGWEERGPQWRGFSSGGTKMLFRFGARSALRLCVTEAAIDALSLGSIEGERPDTLYTSTAGGWAPATEAAIRQLAGRVDILVAATDRNSQGEAFAGTLRQIAAQEGCGFQRLRPVSGDWNEDLTEKKEEEGPGN
ncbi:DUF3991 and toprim domain-containing protein [Rhizobium sp. A22-96]